MRSLIGQGATGYVYRARDLETGRDVALKTLRFQRPEELYRLKREFRALAGINHRNLVGLYELHVDAEQCFFSMELIEGVSFLAHVRPEGDGATPAACDFRRLGQSLHQLALGLGALHAHGRLHRDVKPSNVLVDSAGRVVLLDFGLVSRLDALASRASEAGTVVGTFAYMSPEQAWGETGSPAADWYSVGAMLYEALIGRLPFDARDLPWILGRNDVAPTPPCELAPWIPRGLSDLTLALLRRSPAARPTQLEVLQALESLSGPTTLDCVQPPAWSPSARFVGRRSELTLLEETFQAACRGVPGVVEVSGLSGMGKTGFVEHFLSLLERDARAVVLRARCCPHESVPFKALDGIVDELSRHLLRLDGPALAPADANALVRVFPVLGRVPSLVRAGPFTGPESEPLEIRRRAFTALRALLARLQERRPLVLSIDDFQWSDLDSVALLREIEQSGAPPALLVLAYRSSAGADALLDRLFDRDDSIGAGPRRRVLALEPLRPSETRLLVTELLASSSGASDLEEEDIAIGSGGNPLFACELARRFAERSLRGERQGVSPHDAIGDLVRERIDALPVLARRLIEVVALAAMPIEADVAGRAVAAEGKTDEALHHLVQENLIRRLTGVALRIETAHDQIREAIQERITPDDRRALHRGLAGALERCADPDPQLLLEHYSAGGRPDLAQQFVLKAAERAERALAFHRAASLYERALELGSREIPEHELHSRAARALANAGYGSAAAERFVRAAEALARAGGPRSRVLRLERCGAEQYLRSGHLEEGKALLRKVLASLSIGYAPTPAFSLVSLLLHRGRLSLARRFSKPLAQTPPNPRALDRTEACWSAGLGLAMFDAMRGAEFQTRHACLAARAGDPLNAARAFATEAVFRAAEGGDRNRRASEALQVEARRLALRTGDPVVQTLALLCGAASAYFGNRWRAALSLCEEGEGLCRETGMGVTWELANLQLVSQRALAYLGEFGTLRQRLPGRLRESRERDDRFAAANHRIGLPHLAWLVADDAAEARRQLDLALVGLPESPFGTHHYFALLAATHIDLYCGAPDAAWRRLRETWPALRSSQILRLESVRTEMWQLRGRCAIALGGATNGRTQRSQLLRCALREVRRLEREAIPWAPALAASLRAGAAACVGETERAIEHAEWAALAFERLEMGLHAAAARYQVARLGSSERARSLRSDAETWMGHQGVIRPELIADVLVPIGRSERAS